MSDQDFLSQTSTNRLHWDEISSRAASSSFYPVEDVLAGRSSISAAETGEIGDVRGLRGLHLQAGIGLDTISLSRMGAHMTGVDISSEACDVAQRLARRCGADIQFLQGDVMDRTTLPSTTFDFVYTSHGVLRWLPSIGRWAESVFSLLLPGGWIYLFEIHPLVYRLVSVDGDEFVLRGDYFDETPKEKQIDGTHLGKAKNADNRTVIHTDWTLGSILQSLIDAGMHIVNFTEHVTSSYTRKGLLPIREDGLWRPPGDSPVPLSYSLRAVRV